MPKFFTRLPDLSLQPTMKETPRRDAEYKQANCQGWHQGHDEISVWRGPRHRTSGDEGSDRPEHGGQQSLFLPIALTCAIHEFAL